MTTLARRTYSPVPVRRPTHRQPVNTPTPRRDDAIANAMQSIARADAQAKAEAVLERLQTLCGLEALLLPATSQFLKSMNAEAEKGAVWQARVEDFWLSIAHASHERAIRGLPTAIAALNRDLPGWTVEDATRMTLKDDAIQINHAPVVAPVVTVNIPSDMVHIHVAPPQLNIAEGAIQAHTHLHQSDGDVAIEYAGDKISRLRRSR